VRDIAGSRVDVFASNRSGSHLYGTYALSRYREGVRSSWLPWPTGRRWFWLLVAVWVAGTTLVIAERARPLIVVPILAVGVWGQMVVYEWDVRRRGPKPYRPPWRR